MVGMPRRTVSIDSAVLDASRARRAGVVRVSQLTAAGLAGSTLSYRFGPGGPWQRVLPGIAVLHNGPSVAKSVW